MSKITIDKALLEQALAQLSINRTNFLKGPSKSICKMLAGGNHQAITALREALAQPQPVRPERHSYVPVDSNMRDGNWNHPNDKEPRTAACIQALNARGDRDGQGLDGFWKWGFAAGFNAALVAPKPQPVQEPFGFMNAGHVHEMQQGRLPYGYVYPKCGSGASVAVYTSPQAQPLSNEQITKLPVWRHFVGLMPEHHVEITRAIEQAHGITKGTT